MYMEGILILLSVDILAFNILWLLINSSVYVCQIIHRSWTFITFFALQQQTCKGCKILIIILIVINALLGKCLESYR